MNEVLERRWRVGQLPFNGQTVAVDAEDMTPLPTLRLALLSVVSRLHQYWPESTLLTLDDWHEHDGFVTDGKPASWQSLLACLASESSMLALSQGDWDVRRAYFPDTYEFFLRIYIPAEYDNDYPECRGDFDVTCAADLAAELAEIIIASDLPIARHNAKSFFDRRYGG